MSTLRRRLDRLAGLVDPADVPRHVVVIVTAPDGSRWLARRVPGVTLPGPRPPRFVPVPEAIPCPAGHRLVVAEAEARVDLSDLRIVYQDHRPAPCPPFVVARRVDRAALRIADRWKWEPSDHPFEPIPPYDDRFEGPPEDPDDEDFGCLISLTDHTTEDSLTCPA